MSFLAEFTLSLIEGLRGTVSEGLKMTLRVRWPLLCVVTPRHTQRFCGEKHFNVRERPLPWAPCGAGLWARDDNSIHFSGLIHSRQGY
jgi:hypothetical protein